MHSFASSIVIPLFNGGWLPCEAGCLHPSCTLFFDDGESVPVILQSRQHEASGGVYIQCKIVGRSLSTVQGGSHVSEPSRTNLVCIMYVCMYMQVLGG